MKFSPVHDSTVIVVLEKVQLGLTRQVSIVGQLDSAIERRNENRVVHMRIVRMWPIVCEQKSCFILKSQKTGMLDPYLIVNVAHE